MPPRSSRRLAGCIGIELLLVLAAPAAESGFKAAFASIGASQVLALEDSRSTYAVIVNAAFSLPLAVADSIAAQTSKNFGLERANLLLHSTADATPETRDVLAAIESALRNLQPAIVRYGEGRLAVSAGDRCLIAIDAQSQFTGCGTFAGSLVRGRIRAAYRIIDLTHGLRARNQPPRLASVQALSIGESIVLLSVPANVAEAAPGRIIAAMPPMEDDPRLRWGLDNVLKRVGR